MPNEKCIQFTDRFGHFGVSLDLFWLCAKLWCVLFVDLI